MDEIIGASESTPQEKNFIPLNIQLFAEGDPAPVDPTPSPDPTPTPTSDPVSTDPNQPQSTGELHSIVVGGVEKQLPLAEILKLAQMGDDYTQKTQALASQRREFESLQGKVQALEKYGYGLDALLDDFKRQELEAEAARQQVDPEFLGRFKEMEAKLYAQERQQTLLDQQKTLADKPFFKEWESEIKNLANQYNCDYSTAYALLSEQKMPEILSNYDTKLKTAKEDAIKEYLAQKTRPQGIVEGPGITPIVEAQQPKNFADARKNALELLNLAFKKE